MKSYLEKTIKSTIFVILLALVACTPKEDKSKHLSAIDELLEKIENTTYNQGIVILVDYGMHSGTNRFFIYDTQSRKPIYKAPVSHGINSGKGAFATEFSNKKGSLQTSLGYGVIGNRDYSTRGVKVKYWLKGLETTNSNMEQRLVVFHSYSRVPIKPTYPRPIVHSEGCLMVADAVFHHVDKIIQKQDNKQIPFTIIK